MLLHFIYQTLLNIFNDQERRNQIESVNIRDFEFGGDSNDVKNCETVWKKCDDNFINFMVETFYYVTQFQAMYFRMYSDMNK